jgi:hypothetical protein
VAALVADPLNCLQCCIPGQLVDLLELDYPVVCLDGDRLPFLVTVPLHTPWLSAPRSVPETHTMADCRSACMGRNRVAARRVGGSSRICLASQWPSTRSLAIPKPATRTHRRDSIVYRLHGGHDSVLYKVIDDDGLPLARLHDHHPLEAALRLPLPRVCYEIMGRLED